MKIINKTDNKIVFATELEEDLANAIRRYLGEIPVLAVNEVEISKNGSPLYDETVSHRIGLIPLKTEKSVNEKTTGALKLSTKKDGIVYSGDLKGNVELVFDNIPITILHKGQELELVANIVAGKGNEHARFSPGLMFYRSVAEITMPKEFSSEIKKIFPNNEIKEKGNKIIVLDDKEKEICDICEGICERAKQECETNYNNELIVNVESFGQMPVKEILSKSIETLKKDLIEVEKKISK